MIRKVRGTGQCGWVHYKWFKPGATVPSWKTSYVKLTKAPSGTFYFVGSGIFDMKMERDFARDAVEDAINLIVARGREAFPILNDPASEYIYKDTYVYVIDTLCNMIVHHEMPEMVGNNQYEVKDARGKQFCPELIRTAIDKGYGWVDYYWPKPGTTKPVPKTTYVKSVQAWGQTLVVATGIYLE
jgi:methyl-accepting chemotaxis protein